MRREQDRPYTEPKPVQGSFSDERGWDSLLNAYLPVSWDYRDRSTDSCSISHKAHPFSLPSSLLLWLCFGCVGHYYLLTWTTNSMRTHKHMHIMHARTHTNLPACLFSRERKQKAGRGGGLLHRFTAIVCQSFCVCVCVQERERKRKRRRESSCLQWLALSMQGSCCLQNNTVRPWGAGGREEEGGMPVGLQAQRSMFCVVVHECVHLWLLERVCLCIVLIVGAELLDVCLAIP